ncbi:MAG: glycosyltransferase [Verrucomicrobiales bacterium]|nr:glycosyltransferase [Verrucomicrobiales bacterium]
MIPTSLELSSGFAAAAWVSLALAVLPALLVLVNLSAYRRLPSISGRPKDPARPSTNSSDTATGGRTRLSVLIPARNEEATIVPALRAVLRNPDPDLEVLVLDDHSTDATAARIEEVRSEDPRVRRVVGKDLPQGWCGKQHACWQLAQAARGDVFVFLDADVRLAPDALHRLAAHLDAHPDLRLLSGVPAQITRTFAEKLLIPLIHFVLLGYLPMPAARKLRWAAFGAGCGQLFVAGRDAYFAVDGHRGIRDSLHDGVQLPRAFRRGGFDTDLVDATDLASCRMYSNAREVWTGLGKNATEGMAHPAAILPWTVLLLGGHVLPWCLLILGTVIPVSNAAFGAALAGAGLGLGTRLVLAARFRQSFAGALAHPLGIAALVAIQWQALLRRWRGRPMEWRGRRYGHPVRLRANPSPSRAA